MSDPRTIATFIERLSRPRCDALHVVSRGELIVDWRSGSGGALFDLMSVTKSIVSVVVGRLIAEEVSINLDEPIAKVMTAWRGTSKASITLRQLMAHTSGLDAAASSEEVFASGDVVGFALDTALVHEPGTRFAYNNRAVNLIPAVLRAVTGRAIDELTKALLFDPLGITEWAWTKDAKGTPLAMSGCHLHPQGLAAIGQLMLHRGRWGAQRLLSEEWCRLSTAPHPPSDPADLQHHLRSHGLLWWVLYPAHESFAVDDDLVSAWREATPPLEAGVMASLGALAGRVYTRDGLLAAAAEQLSARMGVTPEAAMQVWYDSTWRRGLPDGRRLAGSEEGFVAEGARGQHLLVQPDRQLVVVQLAYEEQRPASVAELRAAVDNLLR